MLLGQVESWQLIEISFSKVLHQKFVVFMFQYKPSWPQKKNDGHY